MSDRPTFVLASASPARLQTLRAAGFDPHVHISAVDEPGYVATHERQLARSLTPTEYVQALARAKAEDVARQWRGKNAIVLGCDSAFEFSGNIYGKPGTAERAISRITAMSGRQGVLHTGHWLIRLHAGSSKSEDLSGFGEVVSTQVTFAKMQPAEIRAYVASQEPLRVAGSFTLDGLGASFIEQIQGDPHAVVGVSVAGVRRLLSRAGLEVTQLWREEFASKSVQKS